VNDAAVYLDSSAIIKLVFEEEETSALETFLASRPMRVSSALARVEVLRVTRTVADATVATYAHDVLTRIHLIRPDDALFRQAAQVEPLDLRMLDALHLATALSLGTDLAGMVVYDRQLARAARRAGLTVWAPA
jgi:predicted nucleic acid-binding protein